MFFSPKFPVENAGDFFQLPTWQATLTSTTKPLEQGAGPMGRGPQWENESGKNEGQLEETSWNWCLISEAHT